MASFIKLKNTPIKEIIFTISFIETITEEKLGEFKDSIVTSTKFTDTNKGFNTHVVATKGVEPTANISFDGYILRCAESSKVIQARRGSFAFHKVKEYESFDNLTTEFKKYWNSFVKCCGSLTVHNISVRYLNFIVKNIDETSNSLVTIKTTYPFAGKMEDVFTQCRFNYEKKPDIKANVIVADGKEQNNDGVILDIILSKKLQNEQDDIKIFGKLNDMRDVKNDIFFQSITEETIKKYNS